MTELKETSNTSLERIKVALAALPIITAFIYFVGLVSHHAYLDAFGVHDSLFPLESDRYLLNGFIVLLNLVTLPALYTFFSLALFFSLVIFGAIIAKTEIVKRFGSSLNTRIKNNFSKLAPSPSMDDAVDKSGFLAMASSIFLLVIIFLAILTYLSGSAGREQALREMKEYRNNKGSIVKVVTPLYPETLSVLKIICSENYCAFWTGKESILLQYKDIRKMETFNADISSRTQDRDKKANTK